MHLGELELGLSAHPLWKRSVADDISKRLSAFTKKKVINQPSSKLFLQTDEGVCDSVPLRLVLLKHLALGVVANHAGVDEARKV